jgi:hypothetical protein
MLRYMQLFDACNKVPCFGVLCRSKLWPECSASNLIQFYEFRLTLNCHTSSTRKMSTNVSSTMENVHYMYITDQPSWQTCGESICCWRIACNRGTAGYIVVGAHTRTRVWLSGVRIPGGATDLLFPTTSTRPTIQWVYNNNNNNNILFTVKRKEGGRGLVQVEVPYRTEIINIAEYPNTKYKGDQFVNIVKNFLV